MYRNHVHVNISINRPLVRMIPNTKSGAYPAETDIARSWVQRSCRRKSFWETTPVADIHVHVGESLEIISHQPQQFLAQLYVFAENWVNRNDELQHACTMSYNDVSFDVDIRSCRSDVRNGKRTSLQYHKLCFITLSSPSAWAQLCQLWIDRWDNRINLKYTWRAYEKLWRLMTANILRYIKLQWRRSIVWCISFKVHMRDVAYDVTFCQVL